MVTAVFYTEDTYLGNIIEPLTLNRYNYCVSSPLNYVDPSGNMFNPALMPNTVKPFMAEMYGTESALSEEDIAELEEMNQRLNDIYREYIYEPSSSFVLGIMYSVKDNTLEPLDVVTEAFENSSEKWEDPLKKQSTQTELERWAALAENSTAFYVGKCGTDIVYALIGFEAMISGGTIIGGSGLVTVGTAGTTTIVTAGTTTVGVVEVLGGFAVTLEAISNFGEGIVSAAKNNGNESKPTNTQSGNENSSWLAKKDGTVDWKSTPNFGHTFSTHGEGSQNTKALLDRARTPNAKGEYVSQGQWLNNQKATEYLNSYGKIEYSNPPVEIQIPEGLAQVIHPDGTITKATKARIVINKSTGKIRSAIPIE